MPNSTKDDAEYFCALCYAQLSKKQWLASIYGNHTELGVCARCGTPDDPEPVATE